MTHRAGGLEVERKMGVSHEVVTHRAGGLEVAARSACFDSQVTHRAGGLEEHDARPHSPT